MKASALACCIVLQHVVSVLQRCSVLQSVTVCYSKLQWPFLSNRTRIRKGPCIGHVQVKNLRVEILKSQRTLEFSMKNDLGADFSEYLPGEYSQYSARCAIYCINYCRPEFWTKDLTFRESWTGGHRQILAMLLDRYVDFNCFHYFTIFTLWIIVAVCAYVRMWACKYEGRYMRLFMTYVRVSLCISVCIYVCMWESMCNHEQTVDWIYIYTYTPIHYAYICVGINLYMRTCMHMHLTNKEGHVLQSGEDP